MTTIFTGEPGGTRLGLGLAGLSLAVLAGAYGSQYLGGLQPCELCLYQRWPWWAAAGLGALAAAAGGRPAVRAVLLGLGFLALLAGAGIAVFHVGVEQHWWQGLSSCGGSVGTAASVEELRRQIMGAPVVRCDDVAWSLLGISMAGYNAVLSAAVGLGGLFLLWRRRQEGAA